MNPIDTKRNLLSSYENKYSPEMTYKKTEQFSTSPTFTKINYKLIHITEINKIHKILETC